MQGTWPDIVTMWSALPTKFRGFATNICGQLATHISKFGQCVLVAKGTWWKKLFQGLGKDCIAAVITQSTWPQWLPFQSSFSSLIGCLIFSVKLQSLTVYFVRKTSSKKIIILSFKESFCQGNSNSETFTFYWFSATDHYLAASIFTDG